MLGMKCSNSALNAQGSRVIEVLVQVGAVKIYVAEVQAPKKKETQYETQFTTKIGGKPGSQLFPVVKISLPVTRLMPYYAETGRSRPLIA
jgi:hypothetical protein